MTSSVDQLSAKGAPPGRPRDGGLDDLILKAVREILVEVGYHAFSIQEVTRRSKVHVRTIVRRWPTKAELVTAAVAGSDEAGTPLSTPSGNLRLDLRAVVEGCLLYLSEPATSIAMPALIAEMRTNDEVARHLHRRQEELRLMVRAILEAAVDAGNAPAHILHSSSLLTNLITGAAFSFLSMEATPPKNLPICALTNLVVAAALGGTSTKSES
jgi:AcrR family transcriptional regulator